MQVLGAPWRRVLAVARKEFYHLVRDYRSLYLAFALPLLLILLFGYALSLDVDHIPMAVVDYDHSAESRDLIRRLAASPYFRLVAHPSHAKEATRLLDRGTATVVIVIPPDWSRNLQGDREAALQVLLDGSDPNFAGITAGYLTAFFERENTRRLTLFLNRRGGEVRNTPVEGRIRIWFNEDLESRNLIVPGIMGIIIMIVGAMLTALVIAREYENGTMESIKSLPIGAAEFLLGKAIPYFFITLADVLVAILMGQFLFGIVMKASFWIMVAAAALYVWTAVGLGLFISAATKSQLVANQVAPLATFLPSMLLSDFVFPVQNMPMVIQPISYTVPATYFINILKGVYLKNLDMAALWHNFLVLMLLTTLFYLLAYGLLKKDGL
ncbi:MAG: ABC transporter permease [Syntrophales bacterium]|nr:ABC transporter permease [Syntrophales bacterium]